MSEQVALILGGDEVTAPLPGPHAVSQPFWDALRSNGSDPVLAVGGSVGVLSALAVAGTSPTAWSGVDRGAGSLYTYTVARSRPGRRGPRSCRNCWRSSNGTRVRG